MPVDVVHFNPTRRRAGVLGRILPKVPLNNFGDLIGPLIVEAIVSQRGLTEPLEERRVLAVGSIMKLAQAGDTVWGAGVNGKSMSTGAAPHLDVRAVRGPRTRDELMAKGTAVPDVYGDPALLWPNFWPLKEYRSETRPGDIREISVVPNFHDLRRSDSKNVISPLGNPFDVIRQIALSDFVCGSSLHGIIIAEAFGIPARLIQPGEEPNFKYEDYYLGTGRMSYTPARTVEEAVRVGGEPPIVFNSARLLGAFPADLWRARESD